jgi:Fe2+ transport system protein FeoA
MSNQSLANTRPGDVVLVHHVEATPSRIDKLAALGILPGVELRVLQQRPVVVVECGETTLALERELAVGIVVGGSAATARAAGDGRGGA